MLHDAEDFARRRPWAVAGIGLIAGLAASRFLKASSERRYDSRGSGHPSSYAYDSGGNGYGTQQREPSHQAPGRGWRDELEWPGNIGASGEADREVAHDLTRDLSLLVRQEVELAKSEITAKGRAAAPGLGMIGAAGLAGLMAAGAMTAGAVIVLAIFLPDWLSALLVGAALAAAAYGLAMRGKKTVAQVGFPSPSRQSKP